LTNITDYVSARFKKELQYFFSESVRVITITRTADSAGRRTATSAAQTYVTVMVENVSYDKVRRDTMGVMEVGDVVVKFPYDATVNQEDFIVRSDGSNYELMSYQSKNIQGVTFLKEFIGKKRPATYNYA
jgi:hypothetical protein